MSTKKNKYMYAKLKRVTLASLMLLLLAAGRPFAQQAEARKNDRVVFLDGGSKEGKVISFTDDRIQFVHQGETLKYEFTKKTIQRIEYASGRTETMSPGIAADNSATDTRNRVAVLPMTYIAEGSASKMDNMPQLLQEMTTEFMSQSAAELKFRSPAEINALLAKAGITAETIHTFTPQELATVLHVEYLVTGTVMQDKGSIVTVEHYRTDKRKRNDRDWDGNRSRERKESHGSSVTNQQVENQVALTIFNDAGESIYSRSRHSLISSVDGYKNTLRYLLKRTPLYQR